MLTFDIGNKPLKKGLCNISTEYKRIKLLCISPFVLEFEIC